MQIGRRIQVFLPKEIKPKTFEKRNILKIFVPEGTARFGIGNINM